MIPRPSEPSDSARLMPCVAALLAAMVLPATPAEGQAAGEHPPRAISTEEARIPITDPTLLEELGFPPDARQIYALPSAFQGLLYPSLAEGDPEPLFGTTDSSRTGVSAMAFDADFPNNSNIQRNLPFLHCFASSNTSSFASAHIPLPTGVVLEGVDVFAYDIEQTHDATLFVYEVCHNPFTEAAEATLLGSVSTTGSSGSQRRIRNFNPGIDIGSNTRCAYVARIRFSNVPNVCRGSFIMVSHASVAWKRKVRAGPNTATFDDVPTSHPFYDEIEAVAAAGITVDCPHPDKFCPNGVLTRGQMAVLLAKALGLHWPN